MDNIFEIWNSDIITGDKEPSEPSLCLFKNVIDACEMLNKHLTSGQNIIIHCDVDVDGLGSGYITKRFCEQNTNGNIKYCINRDKVHGIQHKHAEVFNKMPLNLLIIVDSSQNDLEVIKKFHCDVLVIDHHEVDHNETNGFTEDGHRFIIVNNVLDGEDKQKVIDWLKTKDIADETIEKANIEDYKPTSMMQCGLTVYELFRVYQLAYKLGDMLKNMMLYQWSAVTLYTDAISMLNERNQWYVNKTICANEIEPQIDIMMRTLNKFQTVVDKQFISFKLAPTLNKAIRADAGMDAINVVLNQPYSIGALAKYTENQDRAVRLGTQYPEIGEHWVIKDITQSGISKNYTGVIASNLQGSWNKQAAVYTVDENGIATGSFRGRIDDFDYRKLFSDHKEGNFAQGHKAAFGFQVHIDELHSILNDIDSLESNYIQRNYLTAGNMPENLRGIHHIDDVDSFKRQGNLLRLAFGNSHVNSQEQIDIIVPLSDAKLVEQKGKLYIYDILGLQCKAFEELKQPYIRIYAEQSNLINLYAKN